MFSQNGDFAENALLMLEEVDPALQLSSITDSDGATLLHLACRWDWSQWEPVVIKLVETHHCDVSAINEDAEIPLHTAAQFNNEGATKYLLQFCDVNAVNKSGLTALDIANQKQHRCISRVLRECFSSNLTDKQHSYTKTEPHSAEAYSGKNYTSMSTIFSYIILYIHVCVPF